MYNEICPPNSTRYVVKKGDTLWQLSLTYGISVQSIIDANPGVNANNLQIGSTLCIPGTSIPTPAPSPPTPPTTCPEETFQYTVKAGDTFWKLSQTYGVSLQSIIDANPGVNANNLQIGSTLCIPIASTPIPAPLPTQPTTCPEEAFQYTVKAGDTFWKLSRIYNVSLQSIVDANPGVAANNLKIGSTLCIPIAAKQPVPTPPIPAPSVPTPPKPTPPAACPKGTFPYVVQAGDTIWQLSQNFGVSLQSIIEANPDVATNNLQIGSTLCIPIAPTPKPVPKPIPTPKPTPVPKPAPKPPESTAENFIYIIKECDTIFGIARKFYVSVESIILINPGINPRYLKAGEYLYIPINCCGRNTFRYVVSAGDTLNRIANQFNVCPSAIIAANPNIDFKNLVRCQIICIPSM